MLKVLRARLLAQLTALTGVGGDIHAPQLILFTNNPAALADQPAVADLTLPTYTGYAAVSPATWGAPYVNGSGQAEAVGPASPFIATGDGVLNNITGAALLNTAGTSIIALDVFDTSQPIQNTGDGFVYVPRYALASPS